MGKWKCIGVSLIFKIRIFLMHILLLPVYAVAGRKLRINIPLFPTGMHLGLISISVASFLSSPKSSAKNVRFKF